VTVSFLVRLVPGALAQSRIVGHVTVIATGAVAPVRSADELIAFLLASAQDPANEGTDRKETAPPPPRPSQRKVRGADEPEES
jgi:hypothetical protein